MIECRIISSPAVSTALPDRTLLPEVPSPTGEFGDADDRIDSATSVENAAGSFGGGDGCDTGKGFRNGSVAGGGSTGGMATWANTNAELRTQTTNRGTNRRACLAAMLASGCDGFGGKLGIFAYFCRFFQRCGREWAEIRFQDRIWCDRSLVSVSLLRVPHFSDFGFQRSTPVNRNEAGVRKIVGG